MEKRMGRMGQMETDFFLFLLRFRVQNKKKSVSIRPIRPIRSPKVSQHSEIRNPHSEIP
jgi:hypothetical protein